MSRLLRALARPTSRLSLTHALQGAVKMSSYSYISASDLAKAWKEQQKASSGSRIVVVDVRDDDFDGGHIKGCTHVPSNTFPEKVQQLVTGQLKDADQVVFHCSLSQARGPKAARMYSEARQRAIADGKLDQSNEQKIQVLRDGFSNFGKQYKNDPELVEDYSEEAWSYR